jgi:hypothetical protein
MNDDLRDLVSAMLAIAYAAVTLVVGELYIGHRPNLPVLVPQTYAATAHSPGPSLASPWLQHSPLP